MSIARARFQTFSNIIFKCAPKFAKWQQYNKFSLGLKMLLLLSELLQFDKIFTLLNILNPEQRREGTSS